MWLILRFEQLVSIDLFVEGHGYILSYSEEASVHLFLCAQKKKEKKICDNITMDNSIMS
jgi:hypothetical protein